MGRQRSLVLLLVICLSALQLIHSSQAKTYDVLDKEELSNELFSEEELDVKKAGLKISTPKVKVPLDTTTNSAVKKAESSSQAVSDETIMDLFEASKHNIKLADDPRFNKMLPDRLKAENKTISSNSKNSTEENYEYDDEDYDYDPENYDSSDIEKDDDDDDDVKETTTVRSKKAKNVKKTNPKLKPIEESTTAKPTVSGESFSSSPFLI